MFSFIEFLTNNIPRLNQYKVELDATEEVKGPEIALAWFEGDNDLHTVTDYENRDYFKISLSKTTKFRNFTEKKIDIKLVNCSSDQVTW